MPDHDSRYPVSSCSTDDRLRTNRPQVRSISAIGPSGPVSVVTECRLQRVVRRPPAIPWTDPVRKRVHRKIEVGRLSVDAHGADSTTRRPGTPSIHPSRCTATLRTSAPGSTPPRASGPSRDAPPRVPGVSLSSLVFFSPCDRAALRSARRFDREQLYPRIRSGPETLEEIAKVPSIVPRSWIDVAKQHQQVRARVQSSTASQTRSNAYYVVRTHNRLRTLTLPQYNAHAPTLSSPRTPACVRTTPQQPRARARARARARLFPHSPSSRTRHTSTRTPTPTDHPLSPSPP